MFKKIFKKTAIKAENPIDDKAIIHTVVLEARRQREFGLFENQLKNIMRLEAKYQAYLMGRMI